MTEDRDKKNWREIEKKKDRGAHAQQERKPLYPKKPTRASERYKAALDKAFEAGDLGKAAERLAAESTSPVPGEPESNKKGRKPSKQKLISRIKQSAKRSETIEAIDELLEHYEMPDDFDVFTRALEHPDESIVEDTLKRLLNLLNDQKPRRSGELRGRLRIMEEDLERADEIKSLAEAALRKL